MMISKFILMNQIVNITLQMLYTVLEITPRHASLDHDIDTVTTLPVEIIMKSVQITMFVYTAILFIEIPKALIDQLV